MPDDTVTAVHDDDLQGLLRSLGIYGDFVGGKLKCAYCQDVITLDNLHSLFPHSGAIKCTCSKATCVKQLMSWLRDRGS